MNGFVDVTGVDDATDDDAVVEIVGGVVHDPSGGSQVTFSTEDTPGNNNTGLSYRHVHNDCFLCGMNVVFPPTMTVTVI